MPNINQPTLRAGSTGPAVRRLQRALRRTPDLSLVVDGVFGPRTDAAVRLFQETQGLAVDGIVGPATWSALPDGGAMPELRTGSTGNVVASLQRVLTNGASNGWPAPGPSDGDFGPQTEASVRGFQSWGGVMVDGEVGDRTWSVSLHAVSATLESLVGLAFVVD
jgi:peptidoglycan hydrolase-like protein with peptidoglycan-binding domain